MIKQELYDAFQGKISKTAFNHAQQVQGKFSLIEKVDNETWDIYLCNPQDSVNGLHKNKINNIVKALLKTNSSLEFHILHREAWVQTNDANVILENLKILGIRKKTALTKDQLDRLISISPFSANKHVGKASM